MRQFIYPFITLFLCLTSALEAQEIQNLYPEEVITIDLSDEVIANFNSEASWNTCEKIFTLWKEEKRDYLSATPEELKALRYCDETQEDLWNIIGVACSWYCGGGFDFQSASSSLPAFKGITYDANNAHDLSYQTAWVEGAEGYGIGEYIDYHMKAINPRITSIIVVNGYVKSATAWKNNSRVKKIKLYIDDKPYALLNLEDSRSGQRFTVPLLGTDRDKFTREQMKAMPDWKMRFEIMEVYPGDKYDDTVITEIYFDGTDVHCLAAGTMITMADGSAEPIEELQLGDEVISINATTRIQESATILELASPVHHDLIKITFDNGDNIICTKDHPFLAANGNWLAYTPDKTTAAYQYNSVFPLTIGSQIRTLSAENTSIVKIELLVGHQTTYTIVKLSRNKGFIANGIVTGAEPLKKRFGPESIQGK